MTYDRRTFLATAASAGLASSAFAKAPMLGTATPAFRRFALGSFEVTIISDSLIAAEGPQSYFATDQSIETVDTFMDRNLLPRNDMSFTYFPVLVNTGEALILFDTGNSPQPGRGALLTGLAVAGYAPEQVDIVVLTHMHPDHIGGMITDGIPTFPNARYIAGATEYACRRCHLP